MRDRGMPRPDGADFTSRVIADREDEIHLRSIGTGKLVPPLAADARRVTAKRMQSFQGEGIYRARWGASGAVGLESPRAHLVQQTFREHASRGVVRAKEEYVVCLVGHIVACWR